MQNYSLLKPATLDLGTHVGRCLAVTDFQTQPVRRALLWRIYSRLNDAAKDRAADAYAEASRAPKGWAIAETSV